jgi:drug/metabolite transporter (DMT)-like permease
MRVELLAGLGMAVACALGTNLGGLWKYKGAVTVDAVDIRHPMRTAVALFRSKWWTIGWLVAALAWALHVGALAYAPISLAQAVISGGLVFLGVLAERFFGFELGRRQWLGLGLVALGMAFLAATAGPTGAHSKYQMAAMAAFEAISVLLALGFILAGRIKVLCEHEGVLLGAAGGLLFGLSDVSIKALTGHSGGPMAVVSPWTLTALLAGIAAFYATARSLQIGDGLAVITATAAAANILGILGGIVVFGDPLGSNPLMIVGRLAAFALVVAAVGLIPAPVRAQEKLADEAEAELEEERADDPRPASAATVAADGQRAVAGV